MRGPFIVGIMALTAGAGVAAWHRGSRGVVRASEVAVIRAEQVVVSPAMSVEFDPERAAAEERAAARKRWAEEAPQRQEQERRRREEQERSWVCKPGATRTCTHAGKPGIEQCRHDGAWSECGLVVNCQPGQYRQCGRSGEKPGPWQGPAGRCLLYDHRWSFNGCDTPLVLSFEATPVVFTDAPGVFDLRVDGEPARSSRWVAATTPWLAVDLDDSGAIEDARELFGSATELPSGTRARHGFAALASHDDDGDGAITERDAIWPRLRLWSDTDQDRRSSPSELSTLASRGVVSIALSYREQARCERDACEVERGVFRFVNEHGQERDGALVDVHFALR